MVKIKNFFIGGLLAMVIALTAYSFIKKTEVPSDITNTIIVGTNAEYQPFEFIQNGQIMGFDIDVMQEIAKKLGKKIEFKDLPFTMLIPELQLGNIHIIAAGLTPTEERAKQVSFTAPYLTGDQLLLISPAEKPLGTMQECENKTIIVNDGYTSDSYISNFPTINVKRLPTLSEAFMALECGYADGYITAKTPTQSFFEHNDENAYCITSIPNTEQCCAFAVSKKFPDLHIEIQNALKELEADGTIHAIKKSWNL